MYVKILRVWILFVPMMLAGCAVRRYHPAPIVPSDSASKLLSRNLTDPSLREFLEKNLGHAMTPWPPKSWDLSSLTFAAFYFSPEMEVARAQASVAGAAVITAGARPNPTLSLTPGVPSPYLFGLDFAIPIQTAGKRRYQILQAQNLSDAARYSLAGTAWKVRSAVRMALLNYLVALRSADYLRSQESVLSNRVNLLEKQLAVGEISRPEVDLARIDLANTQLAVVSGETGISQTRAALSAAIGIPVAALHGVEFSWPNFENPPNAASFSPQRVQREAVLNRLDVRQALAAYAAAEASLQLEISRQYPDIQIGPGYQYEESNSFFTPGVSVTLPIFNRNQGPIAEAEARRKEAAATFLTTQARALADSDAALTRYNGAWKELTETEDLVKLHGGKVQLAENAFKAGESGPLPLNSELLANVLAAGAEITALYRTQAALGNLEDAIERPLEPGDIPPLSPQSPALKDHTKEKK
ncbi:MAG TPA: TolC family protein [Candidatus Acidoferrales bacterium]|jgi:outer membrane protein TolC|nr:TolC family protein [Candidatus Acidoferrales bacterium]